MNLLRSVFFFLFGAVAFAEPLAELPKDQVIPISTTSFEDYFYTKTTVSFYHKSPSIGWGYRAQFHRYFGYDFFASAGYLPYLIDLGVPIHVKCTLGSSLQLYPTHNTYVGIGGNLLWLYPSFGSANTYLSQSVGYRFGRNQQYFVELGLTEYVLFRRKILIDPPRVQCSFGLQWD
jgi:hypothetical protein